VALASTAAAGAFGIAVGPAVFDSHNSRPIGLPGQGAVELRIARPQPPQIVPLPPKPPPATPVVSSNQNIIQFPGPQHEQSQGEHQEIPAPRPAEPAGQAGVVPVGHQDQLPGVHQPATGGNPGGSPRIDNDNHPARVAAPFADS